MGNTDKKDRVFAVKELLNANLKSLPDEVLMVMSKAINAERTRRGCEAKVISDEFKELTLATKKYFIGRPYKKDKFNQGWLSSLTDIIRQDWSHLFSGDEEKKYYVYFHCYPGRRRIEFTNDFAPFVVKGIPFYVGKGTGSRAFDLNRNQGHGAILKQLAKKNYTTDDIVLIVKNGLTEKGALELEAKLIYFFGTRYEKGRGGILVNLDIPKRPENVHLMKHAAVKYKQEPIVERRITMSYSGGMSQLAHDQENESGLDLAEAWHCELDDEMIEVCMYCGNARVNNWKSCCGEMHFEFVKENENV